ncbi:hypothetical protein GYB29_13155 [bacterium]|nr:hypothetical protein [bacterium]
MSEFGLSFIILMIFVLVSRAISEKAQRHLSDEKKVELLDLFSRSGTANLAVVIGIVALYFLLLELNLWSINITTAIYACLFLVYIGISTQRSFNKLRAHSFPSEFIKTYLLSTALRLLGIIVFFLIII